jgi:hypothetical protein
MNERLCTPAALTPLRYREVSIAYGLHSSVRVHCVAHCSAPKGACPPRSDYLAQRRERSPGCGFAERFRPPRRHCQPRGPVGHERCRRRPSGHDLILPILAHVSRGVSRGVARWVPRGVKRQQIVQPLVPTRARTLRDTCRFLVTSPAQPDELPPNIHRRQRIDIPPFAAARADERAWIKCLAGLLRRCLPFRRGACVAGAAACARAF